MVCASGTIVLPSGAGSSFRLRAWGKMAARVMDWVIGLEAASEDEVANSSLPLLVRSMMMSFSRWMPHLEPR